MLLSSRPALPDILTILNPQVYLPSCAASGKPDEGFRDLHTDAFHAAGTTVTTPTPLETIATFVRAGTVVRPACSPLTQLLSLTLSTFSTLSELLTDPDQQTLRNHHCYDRLAVDDGRRHA